jgi:hypothetical protein
MLKDAGWIVARQRGSHRQFKRPTKRGLVTVPRKLSNDLPPGHEVLQPWSVVPARARVPVPESWSVSQPLATRGDRLIG